MSYKGSSSHAEEKIMLARDEKDNLYEPKPNKKAIRILTVAAYVLCVSLAAIILSLYYMIFWENGTIKNLNNNGTVKPIIGCVGQQVSQSEFRKLNGIEKVEAVNPSIGPSLPTGVIAGNRAYNVKEVQVSSQSMKGNLLMSSSTTELPETTMDKDGGQDMQSDQEGQDDTDYQGDEMEEFEIDESSGQGGDVSVVPEYKSRAVNRTIDEVEMIGNEI